MTSSWIAFHLTDRCNLNCDHCLRDPGESALDIDAALVLKVLDQARDVYGMDHVGLTGGEPFLHPRIDEIIRGIAARGFTWHAVTNGRDVPKQLARLAAASDHGTLPSSLTLSLDGADRDSHDRIRGEGSYDAVMRAISACTAFDVRFTMQMAVHAGNAAHVEALALLAAQLGASKVSFVATQPTGTFLDRGLFLSLDELIRVRRRLEKLGEVLNVPIQIGVSFPSDGRFSTCAAWSSQELHVDIHGRLSMCCMHAGVPTVAIDGEAEPDVCGDLNEMSLVQAHQEHLRKVHRAQAWRVEDLQSESLASWDVPSCNWCLRVHGKPHWTEDGARGPSAQRARWKGAWSPGYKASHKNAGVKSDSVPRSSTEDP